MLSTLLVLILLLVAAESTFLYPPFGGINHYSRVENKFDSSDSQSKKSNQVTGCEMEDILNIIGLEEIQRLIEALAVKKGMSPLLLLRKLIGRMIKKDEFDEVMINTIDDPPLPDLLGKPNVELPPETKLTPETSRTPYSISTNEDIIDDNDDTNVVIIPVAPSAPSRTPVIATPENKSRKDLSLNSVSSLVEKLNILPDLFHSSEKNNHLKPPVMINTIDDALLPDLLGKPNVELPPETKLIPENSLTPYPVPTNEEKSDDNDDTNMVIIPVAPTAPSRIPVIVTPESKSRKDTSRNSVNSLVEKLNILPDLFLSSEKNNHLRPPQGATVRVDSGNPRSPINNDIIVTVSPLMTFIETLRQAEIKYQNMLGISHEADVITFIHSDVEDCYIVNSINNIFQNENFGWKVTIWNKDGEVVYDSFCLPGGKDILVKPGTLISLAYIPL